MTTSRPTKLILDLLLRPAYRTTRTSILANAELWGQSFWVKWETLPVDKKLAWFLFLNQTIAVLTLIELFFLRHR